MSNFAKANTTAQWFQDDYPGAVLNLSAETMVLTVHTTEGMTWPSYGGGETAPNYTGFPPLAGISSGLWRAHFPDERSSRALRNLDGGVQTNTLNTVQLELIGTCDPRHAKSWNGEGKKFAGKDYVYWPNASDEQLAWLADLVADMHRRHDLRLAAPAFQAYPASYGARSGTNDVRFSFDQWRSFAGICGHQHVPENVHGDPGNINMAKVITFAKEVLAPPPPPVTTHTRWAIRETAVCNPAGGKVLRMIPKGYQFQVIDGSGNGADGWVQTSAGNWVLGKDTTTRDPALPSFLSVFTHNVKTGRDWVSDVLPKTNALLAANTPGVACLQECYDAPDLVGKVPGYTYRYQGFGFEPEHEGYIEEHSDNVVLVRDGIEVKAREAYEMTTPWKGPKLGLMHDPRIFRRVTVFADGKTWRVVNVHGPFGDAARREFLAWARGEFEALASLGDPVIFIGDWNVDHATLVAAMGPLATIDGGSPDMIAIANCSEFDSENLGPNDSDHNAKRWTLKA